MNGKIFGMMSSKGQFVVKLPEDRVEALCAAGRGEHFDPGHGRLMKEWFAVNDRKGDWVELAMAAYEFVKQE